MVFKLKSNFMTKIKVTLKRFGLNKNFLLKKAVKIVLF